MNAENGTPMDQNDSEQSNATTATDAGIGDIQASLISSPAEPPMLLAEKESRSSSILSGGVTALIVLLALASTLGIAHIVYQYFKKRKYVNTEFAPLNEQEL